MERREDRGGGQEIPGGQCVEGKRIGVLRISFGIPPINGEVKIIPCRAVEPLKRSRRTVAALNTPDLDSGKLSSDISVHLYDIKPAINA
jgi:amidase